MRRTATHIARCALVAALAANAALAGAVPPRSANAGGQRRADASLTIERQKAQTFAAGAVSITLGVPAALAARWTAGELGDASITVTAYRRVVERAAVRTAADGKLEGPLDAVTVATSDVTLVPGNPATVQLTIPVEANTRTDTALQMSNPGLYPLGIELWTDGQHPGTDQPTARVVTFVHRQPTANADQEVPISVAVVMSTTHGAVLDERGSAALSPETIAELDQLIAALQALNQHPMSSRVSATVAIPTPVLVALANDDPDRWAKLAAELAGHVVESSPRYPLDVSVAAESDNAALFTDWLRDGEDAMSDAAAASPEGRLDTSRTVSVVDAPLSAAGGALLRNLGGRLLVLTPTRYDAADAAASGTPPSANDDSSQLVEVRLTDAAIIDAIVVDRTLGSWLAQPTPPTAHQSIIAAAEVVGLREQVVDIGGNPRRHTVVLGALTNDGSVGVPNPGRLVGLIDTLADITDAAELIDADDIVTSTSALVVDGDVVQMAIVETTDPARVADFAERVDVRNQLLIEAAATQSMLPTGDPRGAAWPAVAELVPAGSLDDSDVQQQVQSLRNELAAIRSSITLPEGFSFNLGDRQASIRLRITNTSATPLTVRLRLSSNKLIVPNGDQTETIAANSTQEVVIDVETRTNGKFSVALEVFTPNGDIPVDDPVFLTAKVNAVSGMGKSVTGIALLFVASWWLRHWRNGRRRQQLVVAAERHPVSSD